MQVLRESGRAAQSKSYLWLYRTGRVDVDIILYDYQPGRGGEYPRQFLEGYKGYLQTDGYSGYNDVEGVTQLGCWSYARRKFHEAQQSLPEPLLDTFKTWLDKQQAQILPKSLTGTAITYALNQWEKLNVFLQDGRLEIDNNRSERSIKPVVVGRNYVLKSIIAKIGFLPIHRAEQRPVR